MAKMLPSSNKLEDFNNCLHEYGERLPKGLSYVDVTEIVDPYNITGPYGPRTLTNGPDSLVIAIDNRISRSQLITTVELVKILEFVTKTTIPCDDVKVYQVDDRIVVWFWWD